MENASFIAFYRSSNGRAVAILLPDVAPEKLKLARRKPALKLKPSSGIWKSLVDCLGAGRPDDISPNDPGVCASFKTEGSNRSLCSRVLTSSPEAKPVLISVALHPQFASNGSIYLSYAYSADGLQVRVVRYRETPSGFSDRKVIDREVPAAPATPLSFTLRT